MEIENQNTEIKQQIEVKIRNIKNNNYTNQNLKRHHPTSEANLDISHTSSQ